jgi:hypothetical protein
MIRANIAVVFIGGYHTEIAFMARQARDHGLPGSAGHWQ